MNKNLTQEEKGRLYEQYVNQAAVLERENSKLKSQHVINIPQYVQKILNENGDKIANYQRLLNDLFLM